MKTYRIPVALLKSGINKQIDTEPLKSWMTYFVHYFIVNNSRHFTPYFISEHLAGDV